jgi:hypothetical protein
MAGIVTVAAQSLEQQLNYYDQQMYAQFSSIYSQDSRYNGYMTEIAGNINSTIVNVFGEDKQIVFLVCPSRLGFNAVSFYRLIIFDSLLLDSLRYLAMGKVYYGGLDNRYIDQLAYNVAKTSRSHQMGQDTTNYYDTTNPFNLPQVGPLTPKQQEQAAHLFKEMLASWMCHEGSHCMLDHIKVKLQRMSQSNQQLYYQNDPGKLQNSVNQYMSAKINQELEKEADTTATRWLLASGYSIEGFVTWLKFAEKLEKILGTENAYIRTHPRCSERIKYIKDAAREYGNR